MSETENKEETPKCHYPDPLDILHNAVVYITAYFTGKGYYYAVKPEPGKDYEINLCIAKEPENRNSVLTPTVFLNISYVSRPAEPKKLVVTVFSPVWNTQQRIEEFGLPLYYSSHFPGTETAFHICRTLSEWFEGKDTTQKE